MASDPLQPPRAHAHRTPLVEFTVKDINPILARAKKASVSPLGETPVEISTGTWLLAVKDPDGNFIEVIGPRR